MNEPCQEMSLAQFLDAAALYEGHRVRKEYRQLLKARNEAIEVQDELHEALAAIVADWDNKDGPTQTVGGLIKRAKRALARADGENSK